MKQNIKELYYGIFSEEEMQKQVGVQARDEKARIRYGMDTRAEVHHIHFAWR